MLLKLIMLVLVINYQKNIVDLLNLSEL